MNRYKGCKKGEGPALHVVFYLTHPEMRATPCVSMDGEHGEGVTRTDQFTTDMFFTPDQLDMALKRDDLSPTDRVMLECAKLQLV